MNSSMISKISKAKRYSEEPDRIRFNSFNVTFRGENGLHTANFNEGSWHCTCRFFTDWGACSHTMAMERILGVMIPSEHRQGEPLYYSSSLMKQA